MAHHACRWPRSGVLGLVVLGAIACADGGAPGVDMAPAGDTGVSTDLGADAAHSGEVLAPDDTVPSSDFLAPCESGDDCASGWCVDHLGDRVCSVACVEECPDGFECRNVTSTGTDVAFVCLSLHSHLCRPCIGAADCTGTTGIEEPCIDSGAAGRFCGSPCVAKADCPAGYACASAVTDGGVTLHACVPDSGQCACSTQSIALGRATVCTRKSALGTCSGQRVCAPSGLTDCDAPEPAIETCNGVDDDCDGVTDEGDCDDGDLTTAGDTCVAGECHGTSLECVAGPCDAASVPNGVSCEVTFQPAGVPCDDASTSTKADACDGGGLCVGAPYTCPPGPCVVTSVPDGVGCVTAPAPAGLACDDGDPSTHIDACDGDGVCVGQVYGCTPGPCDASSVPDGLGCATVPKVAGVLCDDGDQTTQGDACDGAGSCEGTPYTCTAGTCQASSVPDGAGCSVTYSGVGAPCDDGLPTTTVDVCDGQGGCAGSPYTCAPTACQASSVPDGAGCAVVAKAAGVACDDGDVSTKLDVCDGQGACSGTAYGCAPGLCELASVPNGVGCAVTWAGAGAPCDDGDPATTVDVCNGFGACHGTPYSCAPGQCDASATPDGAGCKVIHKAAGVPCSDGNPSTHGDVCDGQGACGGTPYTCTPQQCDALSQPDGAGCVPTPKAAGAACDDGLPTTKIDVCDGQGACAGTPYSCAPAQCEAASAPDGAGCTGTPKAAGVACNDGLTTTKGDACDGKGACAGTPYACSTAACDVSSIPDGAGCVVTHRPAGVTCNDGDPGTKVDVCDGQGQCFGTPYTCTPTPCQAASVPDGAGCATTPKAAGVLCSDGNAATKGDICDGQGGCGGTPYACTPGQCEQTALPDGTACAVTWKAAGTACDDGSPATKLDVCDGKGGCGGTAYSCTPSQCDASSAPNGSGCDVTPKAAGIACDDGVASTLKDVCDGKGACAGTPYACTAGQCDVSSTPDGSGCLVVHKGAGVGCNDGSSSTKNDACDGQGGCSGASYTCTPGQCDASSAPDGVGCATVHKGAGAACNDGSLSTKNDVCDGEGACAGTAYTCTPSVCDVSASPDGAGCQVVHRPDGAPCEDGNLCNGAETCIQGQCTSAPPVSCPPPSKVCRAVACAPASGQCEETVVPKCCGNSLIESPEACDDGNAATDACTYGQASCTVCGASCTFVAGVTHVCGDGTVDAAEQCDAGSGNCPTDACTVAEVAIFGYTGAAVSWKVPAGVIRVRASLWGAAGGGSNAEGWQFPGGGGGFASGTIDVTPGETLTLRVGQGGGRSTVEGKTNAWPSGGQPGMRGGYTMGGGGGRSALERSGVELLVAGAGGGAGGTGWSSSGSTGGGGGGGAAGGNGSYATPGGDNSACAGKGGTQAGGGAGGSCSSGGWGGPPGGAGTKNAGGNAGDFEAGTGNSGGGGGDGYYGGGAAALHAGGGGGAGYFHPTLVTKGLVVAGSLGGAPAETGNADYATGVGLGQANASGGQGSVVLRYDRPACPGGATSCVLCGKACTTVTISP